MSFIHYLSLLLADQPRRIDAVIDYFGGASPGSAPRKTPRGMGARPAGRLSSENASAARSA